MQQIPQRAFTRMYVALSGRNARWWSFSPRRCHWAGIYQAFSLAKYSSVVSARTFFLLQCDRGNICRAFRSVTSIFHCNQTDWKSNISQPNGNALGYVRAHRSLRPERAAYRLKKSFFEMPLWQNGMRKEIETGEFWTGFQDFQDWRDFILKTEINFVWVFTTKSCPPWKSWNPV